jgi:hypothetical protein
MTKKPVRELVILTGELIDVRGVDVWVSSENTYMQMARYYDRSVSSMVRYLGAYKDAGGHPVEDVVADELAARMLEIGSMGVQPATVITTGSGELETTHGVRRIYHVAAAQGQVGVGYVPVGNIAECVTNALAELDREEVPSPSILFPLLGLGTASGDSAIVSQLMAAAAQYVRQHPDSSVRKICFLVRHFEDLDLAVAAAGTVETLTRVGGSAETLLDRAPAAAAS